MGYAFPSEEWLLALKAVLNGDAAYARIARNWEGDMLCVLEKDAGEGWAAVFYLDLWHGACREVRAYPPADGELPKVAFVLRAPLHNFYKVIAGELDPMQAMMTRRLKVEGNMAYMLRNVPTVLDFVRCCRLVEIDPKPDFA
jgi:putative sterol carrier protein